MPSKNISLVKFSFCSNLTDGIFLLMLFTRASIILSARLYRDLSIMPPSSSHDVGILMPPKSTLVTATLSFVFVSAAKALLVKATLKTVNTITILRSNDITFFIIYHLSE